MNHADLRLLVDYNYWARDRVLAGRQPSHPRAVHARPRQQLQVRARHARAHVLGRVGLAHALAGRVADDADFAATRFRTSPTLQAAWDALEGQIAHVRRSRDGGHRARVRLPAAERHSPASRAFWQMLQHVVNHGSYHRGQVTTMLRQLGAAPPKSTDLITFYRERATRACTYGRAPRSSARSSKLCPRRHRRAARRRRRARLERHPVQDGPLGEERRRQAALDERRDDSARRRRGRAHPRRLRGDALHPAGPRAARVRAARSSTSSRTRPATSSSSSPACRTRSSTPAHTEPVVAVVARSDASEWEHIVPFERPVRR